MFFEINENIYCFIMYGILSWSKVFPDLVVALFWERIKCHSLCTSYWIPICLSKWRADKFYAISLLLSWGNRDWIGQYNIISTICHLGIVSAFCSSFIFTLLQVSLLFSEHCNFTETKERLPKMENTSYIWYVFSFF